MECSNSLYLPVGFSARNLQFRKQFISNGLSAATLGSILGFQKGEQIVSICGFESGRALNPTFDGISSICITKLKLKNK